MSEKALRRSPPVATHLSRKNRILRVLWRGLRKMRREKPKHKNFWMWYQVRGGSMFKVQKN